MLCRLVPFDVKNCLVVDAILFSNLHECGFAPENPPTDSLVPNGNDRQKIESNVEILEGHLGCMKSTHSMNAATWGR